MKEWRQPNIGHVIESLKDSFSFEINYHPPDDDLRYRFNRLYGVLDALSPNNGFDPNQYQNVVNNELRSANIALSQVRLRGDDRLYQFERQSVDKIIEDATGRLVAPATVATRIAAIDVSDRLANMLTSSKVWTTNRQ